MSRKLERCLLCGQEFLVFNLEPYEMRIPDADKTCRTCLDLIVEEQSENYTTRRRKKTR